jgi:mRNA interferase MazF
VIPLRGELWLVDFGAPVGREQGYRRPALVLSSDRLNRSCAGVVLVVPAKTRHRDVPSHVEIAPRMSGLREVGCAKVEDLKSISVERCLHRLGNAPPDVMASVLSVVRLIFELD